MRTLMGRLVLVAVLTGFSTFLMLQDLPTVEYDAGTHKPVACVVDQEAYTVGNPICQKILNEQRYQVEWVAPRNH